MHKRIAFKLITVVVFVVLTFTMLSFTSKSPEAYAQWHTRAPSHSLNLKSKSSTSGTGKAFALYPLPLFDSMIHLQKPVQVSPPPTSTKGTTVATPITKTVSVPTVSAPPSTTTTTLPPVVSTTTTLPPTPVSSGDFPGTSIPDEVQSWQRAGWYHVNSCEEGGNWSVQGSRFSGGLGISNSAWSSYGGLADFGPAYLATPDEQITVAIRINGSYIPDQGGCASW